MSVIFIGIIILVGVLYYLNTAKQCTAAECDAKQQMTAQTVLADVANGAVLIDVREPDEFAGGHAIKAVNIPLGKIQDGTYKSEKKDQKVYLYCRSGRRAGIAEEKLRQEGYTNIVNLGGLSDWQGMGGKVE